MFYAVQWTVRAVRQARGIPPADRARIVAAVGKLSDWPACLRTLDIGRLRNHARDYRLRVGRYRVLFDVETAVRVVSIQQVRKRDESTY
jgi:mRNA-degrading endonuclease RelE of RelBE toxin-antitoxin system